MEANDKLHLDWQQDWLRASICEMPPEGLGSCLALTSSCFPTHAHTHTHTHKQTQTHTCALLSYTAQSSPVDFHQSLIIECVIGVHVQYALMHIQPMCNFVISRSWVRALAIENDNKRRADVIEAEGGRDKWTTRHSGWLCIDSRGHAKRLSLPVALAQRGNNERPLVANMGC